MRRTALPAAALLIMVSATPALASAGLPKIASLQAGPHKAAIHNDSSSARIGSNTITVEITDVPAGHDVHLRFIGPDGQTIDPALRPLEVLAGPEDAHGGGGHESTAPATTPSTEHGGHGGGHEAAPATPAAPADPHAGHGAAADSHSAGSQTFTARTNVKFPVGGTWKAVVVIEADHGDKLQAEAPFEVTYGGPNRIFVASSGLTMGGFMLYGAVQRRRKSGGR